MRENVCVCVERDRDRQTESRGLRTRRADDVSSRPILSLKADQYPGSKAVKQKERILSSSFFYSVQAFSWLDEAHQFGEGNLLYLVC